MSKLNIAIFALVIAACIAGFLLWLPLTTPTISCELRFSRGIDSKPLDYRYSQLICVDNNSLIVQSNNMHILEIDASDGSTKWRKSLNALSQGKSDYWTDSRLVGAGRLSGEKIAILFEHNHIFLEMIITDNNGNSTIHLLSKRFQLSEGGDSLVMGNARLALAEYPKDGKMQPPNCFAFDVSRSLDAKPLPLTPGLGGYCSATTVSPNGQYAAYALNSVYVWNLESSSLVGDQFTPNNLDTLEKWKSIGAHGGYRPLSCAFSLDSRFLVVAAGANAFAVFEVATGKTLRFVQRNSSGHKISGIRHASFSITSDLVLVREGATFSIYHVPTGKWIFDSWKVSKLNDRMTHDSVAPQVEVLSSRVFVLSQEGEISCFELFIDSE